MEKRLIVAVTHGRSDETVDKDIGCDRLMTEYGVERYRAEVAPLITDRSLLLVEGTNRGLVSPDHKLYDNWHRTHAFWLGGTRPAFASFDLRATSKEEDREIGRRYRFWDSTARRLFLVREEPPSSMSEAVERLRRDGPPTLFLLDRPTAEEVEVAKWILSTSRKFDLPYVQAFRRKWDRFDRVVFFGGAVHALSIALKTGLPLVDLSEPGEAAETYYEYLADYHWSKFITGRDFA